jgi:Hemerythrin HHE cation binding domain
MKFETPQSMKLEHKELHAELEKATKEPGEIGKAANKVAKVLHAHFVSEEEYAMPPLSILRQITSGNLTREMSEVLEMTEKLKSNLPQMLDEHKEIVKALTELETASSNENRLEYVHFCEKLKLHAQTEEEVMYPASILVGEFIKIKLPAH